MRRAARTLALAGGLLALVAARSDCTAGSPAGDALGDALTDAVNATRPVLTELGLKPYLNYSGLMWSDVAGGLRTGTDFAGYLDFGLDIDLAKLGAWRGLGFRADAHWYEGPAPTLTRVGGLEAMALSGWEASNAFRVYDLYLHQSLQNDRFLFKIGQLAADTDFMVSRFAGLFLNAAFGDLPSQNLNIDAPVYPLAAPGAYAFGQLWPRLAARVAVYTGEAGDDVASNHGFGWRLGAKAGWTVFGELALSNDAGNSAYTFGFICDTGGSLQFGIGTERDSHSEFYWMVDQTLAADEQGNPQVGAFARFTISPQSQRSVVGVYGDAGLNVFGPIAGRPDDTAGLAISVLRFTGDFVDETRAQGMDLGSGEALLELTYQAVLAPWLKLQPDLQFVLSPPDGQHNAVVFGVQAQASF
jgi:porin